MSRLIKACVLFAAILLLVGFYLALSPEEIAAPITDPSISQKTDEPSNETDPNEADEPTIEPIIDVVRAQNIIDQWVSSLPPGSQASVSILGSDGMNLVSHNQDQVYFAASIYKLYVAYAGYQQIDVGLVDPSEIYINGKTRAECLDLMIRESDNPCAEKLWNELGKRELTNQLKTYDIENTNMVLTTSTAADAAAILRLIAQGEGMSARSQFAYLESMKNQIFRDALNAGFSDAVAVYNKVGFSEGVEYHDAAIIQLVDGRQAIISVMTENVGTTRIADLATQLETTLQ